MKKIQLLLVSAWPPTRFHAGGQRQLDIYWYLKKIGAFEISLYSRNIPAISDQIDMNDLTSIFDNIYWAKTEILSGDELESLSGSRVFDIIDLQHIESAREINSFKKRSRKLIYTPMESELRNFAIKLRNKNISIASLKLAIREIVIVRKSNTTVPVSHSDERYLRLFARSRTMRIDTPLSTSYLNSVAVSKKIDFEKRNGVVFVAYFGSQTNLDALNWYVSHVHGPLTKQVPKLKLLVVGDKSHELQSDYPGQNIEFLGRVEDIVPYIANARVAISPALHGSGFRGKINQYSILNIPTVAHPLAASGLNYPDGSIMLCNSPSDWVSAVKELYLNKEKNLSMGITASLHANTFKLENQKEQINRIYSV